METKTYFATSIQAAMEVARRELGPDAMLLDSQPTPESMRRFGPLEVSFAWERPSAFAAAKAEEPSMPALRPNASGLDDIMQEISALRNAIGASAPTASPRAEIDPEALHLLTATGLESNTARQVVEAAAKGSGSLRNNIPGELARLLPTAQFLPLQAEETRTIAFVGPAGRGKTTSLVKLAAKHGLANHIPTRIFLAGIHSVGAAEQMARYAAILGIPFQQTETWDSLNLALQGDRWKGLVLIDTSGLVLSDHREMEAMKYFFARRKDIEKHLVLRADARSADMKYMVSRFAPLQSERLFFTGVDEAQGLGAAVETMIASATPASFLGTGPRIPEDMEDVSIPTLVRSVWTANRMAAAA